FIPQPAFVANQTFTLPASTSGNCQAGAIAFQPLQTGVSGQDFSAVVFGDCTGNWQPGGGGSGAGVDVGSGVTHGGDFAPLIQHGGNLQIPLSVFTTSTYRTITVTLNYDATQARPPRVRRLRVARRALLAVSHPVPGTLAFSMASTRPVPGGPFVAL